MRKASVNTVSVLPNMKKRRRKRRKRNRGRGKGRGKGEEEGEEEKEEEGEGATYDKEFQKKLKNSHDALISLGNVYIILSNPKCVPKEMFLFC